MCILHCLVPLNSILFKLICFNIFQTDINECEKSTCPCMKINENNKFCVNTAGSCRCGCRSGFKGDNCGIGRLSSSGFKGDNCGIGRLSRFKDKTRTTSSVSTLLAVVSVGVDQDSREITGIGRLSRFKDTTRTTSSVSTLLAVVSVGVTQDSREITGIGRLSSSGFKGDNYGIGRLSIFKDTTRTTSSVSTLLAVVSVGVGQDSREITVV